MSSSAEGNRRNEAAGVARRDVGGRVAEGWVADVALMVRPAVPTYLIQIR